MTTHADLERLVRQRAGNRCEYCGMHQSLQEIVGTTAVGRATVAALRLNDERRLRIRQAEKMFDLFPPD